MKSSIFAKFALTLAAVLTFAFVAPSASFAQEISPEHLVEARKYIDLTDKTQLYERTLIETGIQTLRTVAAQNVDATDAASDAIGVVIASYADEKDNLFDQMARIYALNFTIEELRQINSFYESEVGQKLASETDGIQNDLIAVLNVFRNNLNTEFFARVRAELRKQDIEI